MKGLYENRKIVEMLENSELRGTLDKIDNSKHRISELQVAMIENQNGEFMKFIDLVLMTLQVKNQETDQLK